MAQSKLACKEELRIVLVGTTGGGKSATGNMILGTKLFVSQSSSQSVTSFCRLERADRFDKEINIIDTPGLFDTNKSNEVSSEEIKKCVLMTSPGPHAFLLVVSLGRFTPQERNAVQDLQKYFGKGMVNYLIVVFTRIDDLEDQTLEQYIANAAPELKQLLQQCYNRYVGFNNKLKTNEGEEQVRHLLSLIETMVSVNDGSYYTNEMLKEAEEAMKRREEEIKREMEEKFRLEREMMKEKFELEMKHYQEKNKTEIEVLQKQMDRLELTNHLRLQTTSPLPLMSVIMQREQDHRMEMQMWEVKKAIELSMVVENARYMARKEVEQKSSGCVVM